jgi:hypothetical protein
VAGGQASERVGSVLLTADEENKKFSQKETVRNIKFGAAMNIIRVCVYDMRARTFV